MITCNLGLALLFPWRSSVWIILVCTMIILCSEFGRRILKSYYLASARILTEKGYSHIVNGVTLMMSTVIAIHNIIIANKNVIVEQL